MLFRSVVHDKEIRTKIARKDNRGRNTVENIIGDGVRASVPSTLGGNTEIASTHNEVTVNNILPNSSDVKVDNIDWKTEILNARFLADIEEVFRKVFNLR